MITQEEKEGKEEDLAQNASPDDSAIEPLIALASALLDTDRLRIAAILVHHPANRMELSEATGLTHRELLRQLDNLQSFGIVRLQEPAPREPDHYSLYELNMEAFRAARQAMGKHKGVRKRPTDPRLMILETFMPDGKLRAIPLKQNQIVIILDEIAHKFDPEKQYAEREVNVILEDINEDYCTLRRYLVDYGYLSRHKGIYKKND